MRHCRRNGRALARKLEISFAPVLESLHAYASLNPPHIAVIYGLERVDGVPFLAMELVSGESLAERLSRGPIPLEEALSLFRQIAEALEFPGETVTDVLAPF